MNAVENNEAPFLMERNGSELSLFVRRLSFHARSRLMIELCLVGIDFTRGVR